MMQSMLSCEYLPFEYLLWWNVCSDIGPTFHWVVWFLITEISEFFVYYRYAFFVKYVTANTSPKYSVVCFILFTFSSADKILIYPIYYYFYIMYHVFDVIYKNYLLHSRLWRFFFSFTQSFSLFYISVFESIFVKVWVNIYFFANGCPTVPSLLSGT